MNFRKNLPQPGAGFQMAPMIDIMFLLLIFFMAAAIYAQWETRIDVTVPTASSGERSARQAGEIIINLDSEGRIFVNDVEITPARLQSLLGQVAREFKDQPIIIRADGKTPHENVVGVLDICREVDIWNIAFATLPKKPE
jgi:biopolymer transport protein ExbD